MLEIFIYIFIRPHVSQVQVGGWQMLMFFFKQPKGIQLSFYLNLCTVFTTEQFIVNITFLTHLKIGVNFLSLSILLAKRIETDYPPLNNRFGVHLSQEV